VFRSLHIRRKLKGNFSSWLVLTTIHTYGVISMNFLLCLFKSTCNTNLTFSHSSLLHTCVFSLAHFLLFSCLSLSPFWSSWESLWFLCSRELSSLCKYQSVVVTRILRQHIKAECVTTLTRLQHAKSNGGTTVYLWRDYLDDKTISMYNSETNRKLSMFILFACFLLTN